MKPPWIAQVLVAICGVSAKAPVFGTIRAMAKNTSISLGDQFADFIDAQVSSGRFGSASEVVRAGLRLLQEHEVKLVALRAALVEGEASGPARPFNRKKFVERMRGKRPKRRNG